MAASGAAAGAGDNGMMPRALVMRLDRFVQRTTPRILPLGERLDNQRRMAKMRCARYNPYIALHSWCLPFPGAVSGPGRHQACRV